VPEEHINLHRLVWSPDDFEGGRLLPSAFPRNDLLGGERYVSVSRVDQLVPDAEIATAESQSDRANGCQFIRDEAWSVLLCCGEVMSATDVDDVRPFAVTPEPIEAENDAHCGLRNTSGKKGRGYVNQLRLILVGLASTPRPLNEFLSDFTV